MSVLSDQREMYVAPQGSAVLSGVQAIVRILFEQARRDVANGLRTASFVSGYPGSPLGGLDQEFQRQRALFADVNLHHIPGHNEELAATSVWGSQLAAIAEAPLYDGVVGMWHAKSPGLDRAADAIRHAQYVGTDPRGGVLACVGDDPGAKSSSLPGSSEEQLRTLGLPYLSPSSVQDIVDLGSHGIAMSRLSGLWTGLRIVTDIADGVSTVVFDEGRQAPLVPVVMWRGKPYVPRLNGIMAPPHTVDLEEEVSGPRLEVAREYGLLNNLNRTPFRTERDWIGILVVGPLYSEVISALGLLGLSIADLEDLGVRVGHIRMPNPIHPNMLRTFAAGLDEIVVVEEKRGIVEPALKDALYGAAVQPLVVGKADETGATFLRSFGTFDAAFLAPLIARRLMARISSERIRIPTAQRTMLPLLNVQRTPFFCAGCPHSSSTQVPKGAHVGGGIGCHGMIGINGAPERVGIVDFTTHMGAEGAQWVGMSRFVGMDHIFQNVGDGTYFHSGQLAVQAAVAAGTHITYKLLVNDAVAMTGGQDPGWSNAIPVEDIATVLLKQGVHQVIITTDDTRKYRTKRVPDGVQVWDRLRVVEAQEVLRKQSGVTVLIHDQRCAAENRRDRKRGKLARPTEHVYINERVCEGCGDCGVKSGCLAVEPIDTEFGRKTKINQTLCNFDYSCVQGDCPSFVTVTVDPTRPAAASRPVALDGELMRRLDGILPQPTAMYVTDDVIVRMPGIGGTGVVTMSHVLAVAAAQDGRFSSGIDQTGMSQKGGPVVSDLHLSRSPITGTNKAGSMGVDLLLAFDFLGAAHPANVATLVPGRSVAVVSSSKVPTGAMVSRVDVTFPDIDAFCVALKERLGTDRVHIVDAQGITTSLFNSAIAANTFLLGVAFQAGALPVSAGAVEEAIRFNGASVESNLAAFRCGRLWVIDRDVIESAVRKREERQPLVKVGSSSFFNRVLPEGLATLADRRAADLVAYQSRGYAQPFIEAVRAIYVAEQRAQPGSAALTEAVIHNMHKLMAYKDEYEVARLCLEPAYREAIREQFGDGAKVEWNLHPPVLKGLGFEKKIRLGTWFTPAFVALRSARRLRGTPFDIFGYAKVRRVERELIRLYRDIVDEIVREVRQGNLGLAIALAELPAAVRGYEELKLERAAQFREHSAELRKALVAT